MLFSNFCKFKMRPPFLISQQSNHISHHYSFLLQKCTKQKSLLKQCKQIHASIITTHQNVNVLSLSSKLIGAYASCHDFNTANSLFQKTQTPNAFAFNMMIMSLNSVNSHKEAVSYFSLFLKLRNLKCCFNEFTFTAILKSCVGLLDFELGKQINGMIFKVGFGKKLLVCNGLIDMYGKCGRICFAGKVFDEMRERDVVSWTTMICRCFDVGKVGEAVELFERMRGEGVECNDFTWNAVIDGCAKNGDCDGAFAFFCEMMGLGLVPDLVTWNAMIRGFVRNGRGDDGLKLFRDLLDAGIRPNEVTVAGLLPSCGMIGSIEKGREIHGLVYRIGLNINVFVGSALIDMYSKCGSVEKALLVFNSIRVKNVASWNAMIACYGNHGMVDWAMEFFEKMRDEGLLANEVTLTSVLSACSHGGQVERGLEIFRTVDSFNVKANAEHYVCAVDLLCRYGRMDEAYDIVKVIGEGVTDSVIGAFLNGCKIHERRDLAENISEYLRMELRRPESFVTLSNIYASGGMWGGVENVRKAMKDKKVHKKPGLSSA